MKSNESSKPTRPPRTFADVAREIGWGQNNGTRLRTPNATTDTYIAGALPSPEWTPGDKDWELLAAMFRTRS